MCRKELKRVFQHASSADERQVSSQILGHRQMFPYSMYGLLGLNGANRPVNIQTQETWSHYDAIRLSFKEALFI